jgi:hypothetical protein
VVAVEQRHSHRLAERRGPAGLVVVPVGSELGLLLHRLRESLVGAPLQRQCLVTLALGMFEQSH